MNITNDELAYIAELSKLEFSEKELLSLKDNMSVILKWIKKLDDLDTKNLTPLNNITGEKNIFREDEIIPSFSKEEILSLSPNHNKSGYIVPLVIE